MRGSPRYKSFWSGLIFWLGARLLSRSGAQLYGADRFLPSSFLDGTTTHIASNPTLLSRFSPKKKEKAASLLTVLADPQYNFFRALVGLSVPSRLLLLMSLSLVGIIRAN